ncbi:MAG TPA: hypothetical protein VKY56_10780 [Chloroflexota bacterium]|nr:hypothetical protein [Chloroflexota bacterium]
MGLNRAQLLQLSVEYAVAVRTSYFVEALLGFFAPAEGSATADIAAARALLQDYRQAARDLAARFHLTGDPHDLRPVLIDQVYRMRDALNPRLVDELVHYGPLDPAEEQALRRDLADLALRIGEIARVIQQLPAHPL